MRNQQEFDSLRCILQTKTARQSGITGCDTTLEKPFGFFETISFPMRHLPVLLFAALLSGTGCGTLLTPSTKILSVYSVPDSANVLVEGEYRGVTPLNLELSNRKEHVVQVHKDGYQVANCIFDRKINFLPLLGDVAVTTSVVYGSLALFIFSGLDNNINGVLIASGLGIGGLFAPISIDARRGGLKKFKKKECTVHLGKIVVSGD